MAWQRVRIEIPETIGKNDREALGAEMVEWILARTDNGMGVSRSGDRVRLKEFAEYSDSYLEAKKAAGKYSGAVDLKLEGEMLRGLQVISHKKGSILIGFENGTIENEKAEWNISGTKTPNRDFLGLTKREVQALAKAYKS